MDLNKVWQQIEGNKDGLLSKALENINDTNNKEGIQTLLKSIPGGITSVNPSENNSASFNPMDIIGNGNKENLQTLMPMVINMVESLKGVKLTDDERNKVESILHDKQKMNELSNLTDFAKLLKLI